MDAHVGELLDELRDEGLLESTIVFWFSDNGGPLPREKRTLYDAGLRIPLMIRFPDRLAAGTVDDQLISFVDFLPTLLSLAGIEPPDHVSGRAFLGRYRSDSPRRYIHAAADRLDNEYDRIRAVSDGRFKYFLNLMPDKGYYLPLRYRERIPSMQEMLRLRDMGRLTPDQAKWFRSSKPVEELFDTADDPHELRNLTEIPEFGPKLAELRTAYDAFSSMRKDYGQVSEADYVRLIWPAGTQPRTAEPKIEFSDGLVTLSCLTEGASIGYQVLATDASLTERWSVYHQPFAVDEGHRVVATAHRIGFLPSQAITVSTD
jgi:arylsulfatase A-like enzyme